jgi:cytoskeletal protein RodZ
VSPTDSVKRERQWPKWLTASLVLSVMTGVFLWGFGLSKTVSAQEVRTESAKSRADAAETKAKEAADKAIAAEHGAITAVRGAGYGLAAGCRRKAKAELVGEVVP